MVKKIDIGQNAKVCIKWNTPCSVSEEQEKNMISLMAKKYGIPEKNIKLEINISNPNTKEGLFVSDAQSMNDPKLQQDMMRQYIAKYDIKDVDFDEIIKIDSQINALIDYDSYEKGKRYSIKWVKWSNFLSYGPDNFFDFTTLHGLVLLNGEPANKSGKSTFAYDLLHFLLFGKTNTNKAKTLDQLFNNYIPDAKTVNVEGCITIDGEDYIIKRTLTRSGKKTKTVSNKVEYYKINGNGEEEPLPEDNQQGATTTATSKIIKEALGNESDFDLIISANAKDLDAIITETTETEKGRLLSRWIGLSVLEDKDAKARAKWNKEISVGRFSDMYNRVSLENEIEALTESTKQIKEDIEKNNNIISECDKKIADYNKTRDILLSSKLQIDNNLLKVDVATLESSIKTLQENYKKRRGEIALLNEENEKMGNVDYSEEEYTTIRKQKEALIEEMASVKARFEFIKNTVAALANAEYCPTCHRKLDNVDNSVQIEAYNKEKQEILAKSKKMVEKKAELDKQMGEIEAKRELYRKNSQNALKIASIKTIMANIVTEGTEKKNTLGEIKKNKDAIAKNSEIDANVNVIDANIRNENSIKANANSYISYAEREVTKNTEAIATKKSYILKIEEEQKTERYWKLYLQMIGKDGISKMVLRNALPIINNELNRLLGDVTDFRVEVTMNDKNDIDFLLIRDGITTRLSAASGLEKTQSALALRVVLGKMSRLSRPPFILLDEVLGTVAKENYDDMKKLYDKITEYYDFVLHITHISDIADWHNNIVTVKKIDNISCIK